VPRLNRKVSYDMVKIAASARPVVDPADALLGTVDLHPAQIAADRNALALAKIPEYIRKIVEEAFELGVEGGEKIVKLNDKLKGIDDIAKEIMRLLRLYASLRTPAVTLKGMEIVRDYSVPHGDAVKYGIKFTAIDKIRRTPKTTPTDAAAE
jgi:hypothetical protein